VLSAVEGTRLHAPVLVGLATGLRPGELLALRWDQLKLDVCQPHLSVQGSLSHVGGVSIKAPKRQRSYRTVPMPGAAISVLRAWRKTQAEERLAAGDARAVEWDDARLVFTAEDGRPVRVDNYRSALRRCLASKGIQHVSPHAFRHTYATHLIEAGVPIAHVCGVAGRHDRCR